MDGPENGVRPDPVRVTLNADGIPPDLRGLPQWVAWRAVPPKKPGDKFGKVPVNPHTGENASTTNAKTWATFPEAIACMERLGLPGVGFVFTHSGFAGVDIDKCRDPDTGEITPESKAIVDRLWSYTEVSPSGCGLHVIVRGKLPGKGRRKGQIEVYDTGRFFTITGVRVPDTTAEIFDRQEVLTALYHELESKKSRASGAAAPRIELSALDDAELVQRASEAKNGPKFRALWSGRIDGYESHSDADLALCSILSFWARGDASRIDSLFRKSGLYRAKWDERRGEQTYGQMTVEKAVSFAHQSMPKDLGGLPPGQSYPLTDTGNSERYVARFGKDLRYCHEWKRWLVWSGGRWRTDRVGAAMSRSKDVARLIYSEAGQCDDEAVRKKIAEWAHASEKVDRRKAMVDLARSEPGIAITPDQLDQHPYLLNCPNGTLDLETLELREHRREDYLTKMCPTKYVPGAPCSRWMAFLKRVIPDDDVRAFKQRYAGYCLTGDTSEQNLVIGVGEGGNGKSVYTRMLLDTLSTDYAIQIPSDLLLNREQRGHPTEIADLFGVRLAIGIETPKGRSFDEPLIKQLTGSDRIRARRMKEDFWEFEPSHKLLLVTNHMPGVSGSDHAMARRLHIVQFGVTIPEQERDKKLLNKLKSEQQGILAWMVAGCRRWRELGLMPPESVLFRPPPTEVTRTSVEDFVDLFVVKKSGSRTRASVLYTTFRGWCASVGQSTTTQQDFGRQMGPLGFGSKKTGGHTVYLDCQLLMPPGPEREDEGQEGQSSRLISLWGPREEANGGSGPFPPQSSPEPDLSSTTARDQPSQPDRDLTRCRHCGVSRWWRLKTGGPPVCDVCHPPLQSPDQIEWIGPVVVQNGSANHA